MPNQSRNKLSGVGVGRDEGDLFEVTILPYLNSAFNLARWLTRNDQDAEDILQDASLRALRSFDTFMPGRDARAWFLAIVRNCSRSYLKRKYSHETTVPLEEEIHPAADAWSDPEALLISSADSLAIRAAIEELPVEYREILVLREWEELSYKEIAGIVEIPLGTVMSRLSRARRDLYAKLAGTTREVQR